MENISRNQLILVIARKYVGFLVCCFWVGLGFLGVGRFGVLQVKFLEYTSLSFIFFPVLHGENIRGSFVVRNETI